MKTFKARMLIATTGKPFLWQTAATVLVGLLHSFTTLLLPLSLGIYYELVFHSGAGKGRILQRLGIPELSLKGFFTFFLLLLLFKLALSWTEKYYSLRLTKTLGLRIREKLFDHSLSGKISGAGSQSADRNIFRFANEPRSVEIFFSKVVLAGTRDILLLVLSFTFLYHIDSALANYILLCFFLFLSFQYLQAGHLKTSFKLYRKNRTILFRFAGTALLNRSAIAGLNRRAIELKRYRKLGRQLLSESDPYFLRNSFQQAVFPVLMYVCLGGLLWIIASHPSYSDLTAPDLFSYILLVLMLIPPLRRIGQLPRLTAQARNSLDHILPILATPEKRKENLPAAIANPDLPLYGRNLYEAIAPFKNEKMRHQILQYLEQLLDDGGDSRQLLKQKPGLSVKNCSTYQLRCYVLIRALLQPSSSLVIPETFWTGISEVEKKRLKDFLFTTNRLQSDEQRQFN
ncbi:ABC transporter transmembrane domain-containing protein [Flavihumibacter stibioxidans]|uniref:ABC transmembrane type-1 domain-containing protein n=1 Tax=Flavihumibacter stibioxidans TaxID=1834163 RepID=A0ABR7M7K2_9BACT|nr:ABC transporter ATP-binding protein [Flavihumibacter stibioxidans]MBC6490509.1 hypothetical protein [Flavihumibacter stibioxidans]